MSWRPQSGPRTFRPRLDLHLAMQATLLVLTVLAASASAFSAGHVRLPVASARCVAPTMQFWKKDSQASPKAGGRSGEFYDDEYDTVSREPWMPEYAENGEVDLANVGGVRPGKPRPANFRRRARLNPHGGLCPFLRCVLHCRRALRALLPRVRLRFLRLWLRSGKFLIRHLVTRGHQGRWTRVWCSRCMIFAPHVLARPGAGENVDKRSENAQTYSSSLYCVLKAVGEISSPFH